MSEVEFITTASNGVINIPFQYREQFNSDIKVILIKIEHQPTASDDNEKKFSKIFGALSHRASPALWEKEEGAWERMVVNSYVVD